MRILIACDEEGKWYVRRIRAVVHDLEQDEKVYHCDLPIGSNYSTLDEAVVAAKAALDTATLMDARPLV